MNHQTLAGRFPHRTSREEYGSPAEWIDTMGLALLIEVLNEECSCEHLDRVSDAYLPLRDCYANPLLRWWTMSLDDYDAGITLRRR